MQIKKRRSNATSLQCVIMKDIFIFRTDPMFNGISLIFNKFINSKHNNLLKMNKPFSAFIISIILSICTISANAQNLQIYNASLTDTSKQIMYHGAHNIVVIKGIKDTISYKIDINNVSIERLTKDTFMVYPKSENDVIIKVLNGNNLVEEKIFKVKRIGKYFASLTNSNSSELSIEEILAHPKLEIKADEYYKLLFGYVVSFDIKFEINNETLVLNRFIPKGTVDTIPVENIITGEITFEIDTLAEPRIEQIENYGGEIHNTHLEIIKRLQPNDKIIFSNIIIESFICSRRRIDNYIITIKK